MRSRHILRGAGAAVAFCSEPELKCLLGAGADSDAHGSASLIIIFSEVNLGPIGAAAVTTYHVRLRRLKITEDFASRCVGMLFAWSWVCCDRQRNSAV